jgi:hypothetical protein
VFSPELDGSRLAAPLPVGVAPGSDLGSVVTGALLGVDVAAKLAQVQVAGSEGVWVPAVADVYPDGGLVRVLRSPLDGGKLAACLGPIASGPLVVSGEILAVNESDVTLTVEVLGGEFDLPYNPSTYDVGDRVHVLRDAGRLGAPSFVLGPENGFEGSNPGAPGGGAGNPGETVALQAVISPQWSGTWNGTRWDSWNPNNNSYGGRSALYQGSGYGSPALSGLAVYGDQIVSLGAVTITRMQVTVHRASAGSGGGVKTAVLSPSPHGGSYPGGGTAAFGGTASAALTAGQSQQIDLPSSVFEAFRTGGAKGLATVGSDYINLLGTAQAGAMALVVQYTAVR